jgi:hypothetical protein
VPACRPAKVSHRAGSLPTGIPLTIESARTWAARVHAVIDDANLIQAQSASRHSRVARSGSSAGSHAGTDTS